MKIISEARTETSVSYNLSYEWLEGGGGFGFPCDEDGNVFEDQLPNGLDNLRKCQDGTHAVRATGVTRYTNSYRVPRIGECTCGEEVALDSFTNTCSCGADYNTSGQRLAPREQWGEETGEHWSDCI